MNWSNIINDLIGCGWTYRRLADRTQSTISGLHDLGSGRTSEPRYELGAKLVGLHRRAMRSAAGRTWRERRRSKTEAEVA